MLELLSLYLTLQRIDLDTVKVSIAVAQVETNFGRAGVGRYNNLHGLRNGLVAPCPAISESNFCIYETPIESYIAFYKIWTKKYGGGLPTREKAITYTANENTDWHLKVNILIK